MFLFQNIFLLDCVDGFVQSLLFLISHLYSIFIISIDRLRVVVQYLHYKISQGGGGGVSPATPQIYT